MIQSIICNNMREVWDDGQQTTHIVLAMLCIVLGHPSSSFGSVMMVQNHGQICVIMLNYVTNK
jgi:hypothetical protein